MLNSFKNEYDEIYGQSFLKNLEDNWSPWAAWNGYAN